MVIPFLNRHRLALNQRIRDKGAAAQPRFKNWGCPSFLAVPTNVQLQPSTASRGKEWGGVSPLQPTKGLWEHRKLPVSYPAGSGRSSSRKRFWGVSFAILCDFTHLLESAFNSCLEMGDSYIPLLSSRWLSMIIPFNLLGCLTPQLEFLGCPDTHAIRDAITYNQPTIDRHWSAAETSLNSTYLKHSRTMYIITWSQSI